MLMNRPFCVISVLASNPGAILILLLIKLQGNGFLNSFFRFMHDNNHFKTPLFGVFLCFQKYRNLT